MTEWYCTMDSPVGELLFLSTERGLSGLFMVERAHPPMDMERELAPERFADAMRQVREYFEGKRHEFEIPLDMQGTPFQLQVWEELRRIPYGATISYGELAERLGNPAAVRAVGAANGRNPVSIIVPCHRVIGSNGSLTGYGGGLSRKQFLLKHEAAQRPLGF
jgi:methylated-DNA-[protein]-cysteine S-methyltransferase